MKFHPTPSLQKDLQDLLNALCIDWGFCIPPNDFARIVAMRRLTADQFASAVLKAEGFDPPHEFEWYSKIKQRFIDRFGNEASADRY
jgi:hypothetical protein